MGSLREEYSRHKSKKQEAINEAAVGWVMENVLLLNEEFNREALQRLQGSISKFNNVFSKYAERVPEVKNSLEQAVELMNRLTMGDKITKSGGALRLTDDEREAIKEPATFMVKHMSMIYNNLSKFFNKDMPALLQFPVFEKAVSNPDVPLKDLADVDVMKRAILHALVPNSGVQAIIKRMHRTMELPALNYDLIASELLNLSIRDFTDLMKVDKVPVVATSNPGPADAVVAGEQQGAATGTNPKVLGQSEKEGDDISDEDKETLLKEIGEVDPNQLQKIADSLSKIQGIIRMFPELAATNQALDQLKKTALQSVASGTFGTGGKWAAAQANMIYTYFDKLGDLWPKIKPMLADGTLDDQELESIGQIINKSQGGIFQKMTNFFKSRPVPALSPQNLTNSIISIVKQGQQAGNPKAGVESFENFFTRLNTLKLAPMVTPQGSPMTPQQTQAVPAQGAGGTAPSTPPAPAQASQGAAAATKPGAAPAPGTAGATPAAADDVDGLAAGIAQVTGGSADVLKGQVEKLIKAGWKLTPPGTPAGGVKTAPTVKVPGQ